ncbi:YibE/F family protein [Levilactobacillus suantsaii]|uniref:YibE/F family protein n=1 Tax=Levilactobacillus suantsaii TaxID=2292255 RepID=A0A4V1LFG2_9LACO|nr:YibE/F family protein [Levilactobacillus suantsaii]QMU08183.1 YibE/F family protein [Levilactobacillus suantsaii]RXI79093.1 YibE/F family protein [Levilactobacillus suantsaii]
MSTITVLGLLLLLLMILVGGKAGAQAFFALILNFGLLFLAIVLVAFHFSPLIVTLVVGVLVLALTIFMSSGDDLSSTVAFLASVGVLVVLVLLIVPVEHWALVQGFGPEDSEDLEGLSVLVGISFVQVTMATAILSTLGAIAEAAMAISAGLSEILEQHPQVTMKALFGDGITVGKQIIGTTFNTLFFGFFGGFLALFIWFTGVNYSFGEILNDKIFVAEVLMVLFAMFSVLLTVPITTWVMTRAIALRRKRPQDSTES